ncbi:squalene monooxygenase [Cylindrobasidium torrendii FP15055 ss-10]|uniref:Squalene monooxygenase n=1 Tax=Cylindrobasidium torrendii FP15055 ss-10 TaxID=1314674 RepID=A0A0D7AZA8_9AGAR|nr:squalene monooxygenase [Cylindrobasidium torrendii FP15055 ss-10]
MVDAKYDVIIVGAGVAGCTMAHALSDIKRDKPLRVAVLERSLEEPDRIVGELLQPGGLGALKNLGMGETVEGIDAAPVNGYCVVEKGRAVHIPYSNGAAGCAFHHGKFIQNLRVAAKKSQGVEMIEATVTSLIESNFDKRVTGVRATRKGESEKSSFFADLVIIADGCFSNFRAQVMGEKFCKPVVKGHFIGLVLEDCKLPYPHHGTVVLAKDGPVLLYTIGTRDTRLLIDVKQPVPNDLKAHITRVAEDLPAEIRPSVLAALEKDRIRRMPNNWLPAVQQGRDTSASKSGVFLVGDAWNMRHPLTGGGMTVAFNDVVILRDLLAQVDDFGDWDVMRQVLNTWHWQRKPLAGTVNVLSVALYDLFDAEGEELEVLRTGCFKYFERGGECIRGPVSLLSVMNPSPRLLFYHFFSVALYSIWVMFTHPRLVQSSPGQKPQLKAPRVDEYPMLAFKALRVFWTACIVFGPLLWTEIRWWSPEDTRTRNAAIIRAVTVPLLAVAVGSYYLQSS